MDIQRIAAFSTNGKGGNPAGVVLVDILPSAVKMQAIAAEINYSETVFAAPQEGRFRVRYFAPKAEVPFCGHATIALGAALGQAHGAGVFKLILNDTEISVEALSEGADWSAVLKSPQTKFAAVSDADHAAVLELFGWQSSDLAAGVTMIRANAGAEHILVPLAARALLRDMVYDFEAGAALMQRLALVTINLYWRETATILHCRNPFAGHGVYEDPATGAAAAALTSYLRDDLAQSGPFTIHQGVDMGVPSLLSAQPLPGRNSPVLIGGATRTLTL